MSTKRTKIALPLTLLLAGCGGGTTVVLDLTDAPPDVAALEHVYISLGAVEVHVAGASHEVDPSSEKEHGAKDKSFDDGGGWQTVSSHAGRFDLIALQNDATAALGELELPDGKITQIRLFIDEQGENAAVLSDARRCDLDLSNVDKTGIKINHPFKAIDLPSGGRVRVVIDFDLRESVDQQGDCSFSLKPVIKIKKIDGADST